MIEVSGWIKANWLLLTILIFIVGAFTLLRTKPSDLASLDELNGVLSADQPTVVEFYSNF
jgi:hypothetical protein